MKVSVLMITYNHEKFIAQAIESVLMQRVNFDYELVIGEDCSTDKTRGIVIDYQKKYPEKIHLLLSEKNIGGKLNFIRTYQACQSEYIAWLDGDDYWTDSSKLQEQVDFLDTHPEYAICFHPVWKVYENEDRDPQVLPEDSRPIYRLPNLLEGNFIPACSTVFRRGLFGEFPDWFFKSPIGDWSLHVLNAQYGDIGCLDEVMGVYRFHGRGTTAIRSPAQRIQTYIEFYKLINAHLNFRYDRIIRRSLLKHWEVAAENVAEIGLQQRSVREAQITVGQILDQWPESIPATKAWKSKVWGKLFVNFAFAAQKGGDLNSARDHLFRAIQCDPQLLLNLGVWSAGIESFLGRRATAWLKYLYRKAKFVTQT